MILSFTQIKKIVNVGLKREHGVKEEEDIEYA
jgi:hypothetical protein